jgi:hypothetical protein
MAQPQQQQSIPTTDYLHKMKQQQVIGGRNG